MAIPGSGDFSRKPAARASSTIFCSHGVWTTEVLQPHRDTLYAAGPSQEDTTSGWKPLVCAACQCRWPARRAALAEPRRRPVSALFCNPTSAMPSDVVWRRLASDASAAHVSRESLITNRGADSRVECSFHNICPESSSKVPGGALSSFSQRPAMLKDYARM